MVYESILIKLQQYCAYQDRCHSEVRNKLISLKVYGDDLEEIISNLIQEDFLNEERFAKSFVRGKFNIKKWGRVKIINELRKKFVSEYCIKKGLLEISDNDYRETLRLLIQKQMSNGKDKHKTTQYLLRKGFEYLLIQNAINKVTLEEL